MNFREFLMTKTVNLLEATLFDSSSLFKEMAILNPNAIAKTQTAMQFIHDNNIPGVIIGGMAVANYATDRALTPDVDFLTSDISKLKVLLQQQNIQFQPLASSGNFGGIYVPSLDADFLDASEGNVGLNKYILQTATTAKIGGVSFPIIDAAVLTIMKFIIGRDKDQNDAFKLLPTISKDVLKIHLKALSRFLPEEMNAKTIWSYAKAMAV
jgi:predicted nucleotidyltransferase